MAEFSIAYKKTATVEGGYANNPRDTGGETWKGISRNNETNWIGWPIIDMYKKLPGFPGNLKASTELENAVLRIYKSNYWDALNLSGINDQRMANELYDTGVNMGTGRAAIYFQRVLNVIAKDGLKVDGSIGPKTISFFNSLRGSEKYIVWKLFNCLQGEKYVSICENNPSQKIFIKEWASRVFEG